MRWQSADLPESATAKRVATRLPAITLSLALGALLIGGCGESSPEPVPASEPIKKAPAGPEQPAESDAASSPDALHIAVPPGTVVRSGPERAAEAIRWLRDGGLFPVLAREDEAYQIEIDGPDGEAWNGWVRSTSGFKQVRIKRSRLGPQEAPEPDTERLAAARKFLDGGGGEEGCGPYRLFTDVEDAALVEMCRRLASGLDDAYGARFGVEPLGPPRGAVVIFRELASFRAYVAAGGAGRGTRGGHAGHAQASRGLLVLYVGDKSPRQLAQTLVHELTHLVNRRALGTPLPRWLSEGLADALGDPATPAGLRPVTGIDGAEPARRRVLERPDLPDVRALTSRDAATFDSDPRARDYEQGAVLVRFLLSGEHAPDFRAYLAGVAAGESAELDRLLHHMRWPQEGGAERLDQQLRHWLESL